MNEKNRRIKVILALFFIIVCGITGCSAKVNRPSFNNNSVKTRHIPFVQEFRSRDSLKTGVENRTIDFTGDLTPTHDRRQIYLAVFSGVLSVLFVILFILFRKNNAQRELLKGKMVTLSTTLDRILNNLDTMIYVTLPKTDEILFMNESMKKHYGIKGDCVGQVCYKILQVGVNERCSYCPCFQLEKNPDAVVEWEEHSTLTGRIYHNTDRYIEWIGNTIVHLQQAVDVTEMISAKEAAQAASRAKSEFLAKMSHEMRTPMNAVMGMAELALRENDLDAARRHIYTIKQAGVNLLAIINDILDLSKVESGKLEIIPDYYLFSSLVNDVISIIRMRAIDSQLRFVVTIDSNIPNELYGDETRIRQVLINILGNAIKYTNEGFVSFTVIGDIVNGNTINLSIDITDSGKGIKQEDIDLLFDDYVQVDTANNRNIEGVGLGLSISYNLLKIMGGNVTVYSEYGKGSTFTVTLPQKFRSAKKHASVEKPEEKNVLIFERRDIYANSIVCTVDNLGVSCDIASNEDEFRDKITKKAYSFIFIAPTLYKKNKDLLLELGTSSKIVFLTEFGEMTPNASLNNLAMPVYSLSVANVLNNAPDTYSYRESAESFAGFIAPEAKVLVVDDIRTNLTVTEGLLLPYDMQVDLRKSGAEAINAVQSNRYDLIFMDHRMPGMDGVEATKHIRELGKNDVYYKNVPIIALTANAITGTQDMFMENDFNGFLAKPIDTVKLNALLEKWIPREKQKNPALPENRAAAEKEQSAPSAVLEIEGLNVTKGITLTGGTVERYLKTLSMFYEDGLEKIKELEICLETGNIPLYTINVHALKSASANIGAIELSADARELEEAGKQMDLNFIKAHTPEFLKSLELLLNNIFTALSARKSGKGDDGDTIDADALKRKFVELKTALEIMDAGTINRTVDDLSGLRLPENISAAVHTISRNILMAEYDEALTMIETLIQEGN